MVKGSHQTEEAKQKLREARLKQLHPHFLRYGITREQFEEATTKGLRWCSGKCKAFVPQDQFYGKYPRCKNCTKSGVQNVRDGMSEEERRASADYFWDWRAKNHGHVRRAAIYKKYAVTPEWYTEKLKEQGGHCALCPQTVVQGRKFLFIDHDHSCCPDNKQTCGSCVRGILCYRCNTMLAAVENKEWMELATAYLARYR
jgi:Recombination endonuclease VII